MKCPSCKLENPPSAQYCDCGYNFESKTGGQIHVKPMPVADRAVFGLTQLGPIFKIIFWLGLVFLTMKWIVMPTLDQSAQSPAISGRSSEPAKIDGPLLELIDWNWHIEYGYAVAEGRVKNISNSNLKGVQAVATFLTKDGDFITSDSALVEYNPILPGQISPFKVMATRNPAMRQASIEFKEFSGGTIEHKTREKTK